MKWRCLYWILLYTWTSRPSWAAQWGRGRKGIWRAAGGQPCPPPLWRSSPAGRRRWGLWTASCLAGVHVWCWRWGEVFTTEQRGDQQRTESHRHSLTVAILNFKVFSLSSQIGIHFQTSKKSHQKVEEYSTLKLKQTSILYRIWFDESILSYWFYLNFVCVCVCVCVCDIRIFVLLGLLFSLSL